MGQFGQVEIVVECENKEAVDKICDNLEAKVTEFIKKKVGDAPFHFDIDEVDGDSDFVYITVSSDRAQNAEWRAEMIEDYLIRKHKEDVVRITGEMNVPTNILYWEKDGE